MGSLDELPQTLPCSETEVSHLMLLHDAAMHLSPHLTMRDPQPEVPSCMHRGYSTWPRVCIKTDRKSCHVGNDYIIADLGSGRFLQDSVSDLKHLKTPDAAGPTVPGIRAENLRRGESSRRGAAAVVIIVLMLVIVTIPLIIVILTALTLRPGPHVGRAAAAPGHEGLYISLSLSIYIYIYTYEYIYIYIHHIITINIITIISSSE